MKISIIIPVYNSREYIAETVHSLLRQDFDEFEILLVDDGSSDGSGEICRSLEKEHSQVRAFFKQNGGVCSARNLGLREAQGDYIGFVDNDDECLPGFLAENYALLQEHQADIVRFVRIHQVFRDGKLVSEERTSVKDKYVPSGSFYEELDDVLEAGHGVWVGLYRKEFLEKYHIRFSEEMRFGYEDMDFMAQVFQHAPGTVLNSKAYYIWKMRYDHSTSAKADMNAMDSLLTAVRKEVLVFQKAGYAEKRPADYLDRITEYIYIAVRYVSPVKVRMKWEERIRLIRHFGEDPVFHEKYDKAALIKLRAKSYRSYIVFSLFRKERYSILLMLIAASHRLEELRGHQ